MLVKRKKNKKYLDTSKIKQYNDCNKQRKGVERMKNGVAEIKEVKDISTALTRENKKYVIAVANALLFSQGSPEQPRNPPMQMAQS